MDLKPNEILELSEEELNKLSTEELEKYFDMCQYNEEFYHTQQLVEKIMINSLYGAVGKEFFPLFNLEMARAITGNGRFLVKNTANMIEERLQELNPHSGKYILYGDTDSCIESTLINTNKGKTQIGEFYNSTDSEEIEYKSGKFFKEVKGIKALSVNKNFKLEYKPIKYVMKHKVKKRLFKVKCNENEVIITNDHSIMVKRDNKLIEVKPFEIRKTDKLILVKENKNA